MRHYPRCLSCASRPILLPPLYCTTSDSMNSLGGKVVNMHASAHVDEAHQHVTMLFAIQPGPALRSYGINVAQAVRFPAEIVTEAKRIEARLLGTGAL